MAKGTFNDPHLRSDSLSLGTTLFTEKREREVETRNTSALKKLQRHINSSTEMSTAVEFAWKFTARQHNAFLSAFINFPKYTFLCRCYKAVVGNGNCCLIPSRLGRHFSSKFRGFFGLTWRVLLIQSKLINISRSTLNWTRKEKKSKNWFMATASKVKSHSQQSERKICCSAVVISFKERP